ncbi:MAG: hypothetical protein U0670_01255 [Anaerolineae bacterium]
MDPREVVNYSDLINQHGGGILWALRSPLLAIAISFLVAIPMLLRIKSCLLSLLIVPLACYAGIAILSNIFCDGTRLYPVDTLEFGENTYHLTVGSVVASGMDVSYEVLYLHRCQADGTNCHSREVARSNWVLHPISDPRLEIDTERNELVVSAGGEILLRLNQNDQPLPTSTPTQRGG